MKNYRKGVGAFLINHNKQVLVAKRLQSSKYSWQLPQGGIDENETPETAILRELKEEIGLTEVKILVKTPWLKYDLPLEIQKNFYSGKYTGQEQIWFGLLFLGDETQIDLNHTEHPEFSAWRWEKPKNIISLAVGFKRELYKEILQQMVKFHIIDPIN